MALRMKRALFVQEYLIDLNASQAAIRAGYSKKTAGAMGHELLKKPEIAVAIQEAMEARAKRTEVDQDFVLAQWSRLIRANPNELTSIRISACRHCHGNDHMYQWRHKPEFDRAFEEYWDLPDERRMKAQEPLEGGGYGFSLGLKPVAECPHCDGLGDRNLIVGDTTELSPEGQALFAGVKETQAGIEIKMHDQAAALVNVAKHLGMFTDKVELTGKDGGPVQTEEVTRDADDFASRMAGLAARSDGAGTSEPESGSEG